MNSLDAMKSERPLSGLWGELERFKSRYPGIPEDKVLIEVIDDKEGDLLSSLISLTGPQDITRIPVCEFPGKNTDLVSEEFCGFWIMGVLSVKDLVSSEFHAFSVLE